MNHKISYIIVSYNVKEYLILAIQSIIHYSSGNDYEIIMVDNNSSDDTVTSVQHMFPSVHIIQNNYNAGFSEANNQGIKASTGEFIFLLNPDAELTENTLSTLINKVDKSNSLWAPCLKNTDGTFQKSYWKTPTAFTILSEIFFIHYVKRILFTPKPLTIEKNVECVSGAAMFFKRTLTDNVGLLDPNLFWMEDTDFCYRIRKNGGFVKFIPDACVIHHGGKSSATNQPITISNQIISKIKFFKKHAMTFSYRCSIFLSFFLIIEKIILFGILCFVPLSRKKCTAYHYSLKQLVCFLQKNNS